MQPDHTLLLGPSRKKTRLSSLGLGRAGGILGTGAGFLAALLTFSWLGLGA